MGVPLIRARSVHQAAPLVAKAAIWSIMPKSAKRFSLARSFGSDNMMLQLIRIDHVHEFGSRRSKFVVI